MSRELRFTACCILKCALAFSLATCGCASLQRDASSTHSSDDSSGLSWSDFNVDNLGKTAKKLTGQGPDREKAKQLYRQADDLYVQAIRAEPAQRPRLFEMAAPLYAAAADRWPDSSLAIDGLFMAGESYFFADNYPEANDHYEKLIKAFPNNRYLDKVDQRRFAIARYWLDLERENPEPFYYANWINKARPWRDARGNGLRVFDKIRIDDPTGRLADDATLAAANEHFASGKFYKADDYYTDLRKAYPTSEHQFLAHFLGLKAKLNNYKGPAYGGSGLDEAEKLIKQIRRQFPQEAEKERVYLERAAAEIRYRKAERLAFLAEYHDHRAEYRAAQHYYDQVVRDYRDTPLAQKAEERIAQIAGLPPVPEQMLPWLVALFPESDKVKPLLEASKQIETEQPQVAEQPAGVEVR
jgi:outer membrane protein assembly factor BamD (BamD/ComL family)